jgi:hypothetical protein
MIPITPDMMRYLGIAKYAVIGLCVLTMLGYTGCLRVENSSLKKDLEVANAAIAECRGANSSNQETIDSLKEANEAWASTCGKVREAVKIAGEEADKFRTELRQLRRTRDDEARRKDYANPECAELLATDFGAVCPAIAEGLRERASSSDRYGEGAVPGR